ncbi:MAG TPA: 6-carboxytetrahydropterin synthase QueD, partial [Acidimicrobiales bacterium]|nr:6-carboxytetrahydropterin synthase QueD [Acidimicrobiales bacterium]
EPSFAGNTIRSRATTLRNRDGGPRRYGGGVRTSVTRAFTFEASHQLPFHSGKCKRLHGHGYRLEVTVTGPVADDGMVLDFAALKDVVHNTVIDRFDHQHLNDLVENPTAEVMAAEIWSTLVVTGLAVTRVRLWETADCMVEVTA